MENQIELELSRANLEYMIDLITLDLALNLMTRNNLTTRGLKERLNARIDANREFLNYLREKRHEATPQVPATRD